MKIMWSQSIWKTFILKFTSVLLSTKYKLCSSTTKYYIFLAKYKVHSIFNFPLISKLILAPISSFKKQKLVLLISRFHSNTHTYIHIKECLKEKHIWNHFYNRRVFINLIQCITNTFPFFFNWSWHHFC